EPMQPLALSLAVLELLRSLSARGALALGIDDIQWLDESSAAVLRFALRRLEDERLVVIASQRTDAALPEPPTLSDVGADRITRVPVPPLGIGAIEHLLDELVGVRLAPTMLRRVHRLSGGNPLHALEIGRALEARGLGSATD